MEQLSPIKIYTDGSCHTQHCIGSWVAILLTGEDKLIISGKEYKTTHNRMELTAVIKAIEYAIINHHVCNSIQIITDSQYVAGLATREKKLAGQNFITKKGSEIKNADLVKKFLANAALIKIEFVKIKAHQKNNLATKLNIEADKLARQIVRQAVKELTQANS